jgi:uncharacterized membrane protein
VFGASIVEFVEALRIIRAVGVTRQIRSTLIVGVFGPAIVQFIPIAVLRLVVGALLVIHGIPLAQTADSSGSSR